jgi:hypothetical protein
MKRLLITPILVALGWGCAHPLPYKQTAYAKLKSEWTIEQDFARTWKGIEASLSGLKVTERDPDEVDEKEWATLKERTAETDWINSRSRDKYVEVRINDSPSRRYLQTRYRFRILATKHLAGTHVVVQVQEQVEGIDASGESTGFTDTEDTDTSLAREMIEKIKNACHS